MIQRIQSFWLLLASVCAFASFKLPYYTGTNMKGIASYKLLATENILLMFFTAVVGMLALILIFLYKRRPLQLKLCVLGIFLEALVIFLYYRETKTFVDGTYALTAILPAVIVFSFFIAARAISKDEKMVRNSNRLR